MRIALYIAGGLVALLVAIFGLQIVASERVEVVELGTIDEGGDPVITRLWIVDHDGRQYLRAGPGSGWFMRATSNESVSLTRGGSTSRFNAMPRPELRAAINDAMQQKYTWGDTIIEYLVGGRDDAIPVELNPAE